MGLTYKYYQAVNYIENNCLRMMNDGVAPVNNVYAILGISMNAINTVIACDTKLSKSQHNELIKYSQQKVENFSRFLD